MLNHLSVNLIVSNYKSDKLLNSESPLLSQAKSRDQQKGRSIEAVAIWTTIILVKEYGIKFYWRQMCVIESFTGLESPLFLMLSSQVFIQSK
jgi:hypothetical protein